MTTRVAREYERQHDVRRIGAVVRGIAVCNRFSHLDGYRVAAVAKAAPITNHPAGLSTCLLVCQ